MVDLFRRVLWSPFVPWQRAVLKLFDAVLDKDPHADCFGKGPTLCKDHTWVWMSGMVQDAPELCSCSLCTLDRASKAQWRL